MTWSIPPGSYSSAPYFQHYYRLYPPDAVTLAHQSSTPQEGASREFVGFQPDILPETA